MRCDHDDIANVVAAPATSTTHAVDISNPAFAGQQTYKYAKQGWKRDGIRGVANQFNPVYLGIDAVDRARQALASGDPYAAAQAIMEVTYAAEQLVCTAAAGAGLARGSGAAKAGEEAASTGWRLGDDIWATTKAGNDPTWSTVRARYWKNGAAGPDVAERYGAGNVARMQRGRAPQRYNPNKGGMESLELSHEPVPARRGGQGLVERWPCEHAAVDPFRHPGYC